MKHGPRTALIAGITSAFVSVVVTAGAISAGQVTSWNWERGQGISPRSPRGNEQGMGGYTSNGGAGGWNIGGTMGGGPAQGNGQRFQRPDANRNALMRQIQKIDRLIERLEQKIVKAEERMAQRPDDASFASQMQVTIDSLNQQIAQLESEKATIQAQFDQITAP